ncbi:MAG: hypothetical protein WAQ53_07205 [Thiofilum sp.]|uniref:hypothetical protein n=1 Tax=Thiofilum sp. TaxID=2212733 RepID=UPI0025CEA57E|nr:hypothetical protein [Thiofilum sp.]MBK8455158.1 hypothetical protein [Thiofilum sp.]
MQLKQWMLASFLTLGITLPSFAASPFIGINTNESTHFDASLPFVDLFKTSEPFRESSLTKGTIQVDNLGWVRSLNGGQAGTYFIRWMPYEALPKGQYTVRYQGKGVVTYQEDVKVIKHEPNQDIIELVPNASNEINAGLVITQSDPKDPIRNIQITMPGGICQGNPFKAVQGAAACGGKAYLSFAEHSAEVLFNPDYLNFMKQFKTIRFMNMSGITRNEIQSWQQMPNVAQATWGGKEGKRGVPLEVMIQMANTLNANAWFNIPHRANDQLVQQYAALVAANLRPTLKAYIEYTNEAWNEAFSQAKYVRQMGMQQGLGKDPIMAGINYYGKRSKQIFQLFEQAFGGKQRLVRVIGGWSGRPDLTPYFLKPDNVYEHTDVFAIAPYFYAHQNELMQAQTVNDVFALINDPKNPYGIDATLKQAQKHAELIAPYKVRMVAYEGGQHLVHYGTKSRKEHPNPLLSQANRDPRMGQAYTQLLQGFKQAGGQLFVAFSSPRPHAFFGFWGMKEHILQPDNQAPKLQALQRF